MDVIDRNRRRVRIGIQQSCKSICTTSSSPVLLNAKSTHYILRFDNNALSSLLLAHCAVF